MKSDTDEPAAPFLKNGTPEDSASTLTLAHQTRPARPAHTDAPHAPRASHPPHPRPPGDKIGRYVLQRPIGQGGMGAVYAAWDPQLGRPIALKLLQSDVAGSSTEQARLRLQREAQAIARLSHPHVVAVHDVGQHGDEVFVAMELVDGGTLRTWLAEKRRSWREILEVFLAAGRGLQAAHAAGLVHRDFKPGRRRG